MQTRQTASPFLKWAGGKTQLIEQFKNYLPSELNNRDEIKYYYEPFLGSGAFFFWLVQHFKIKKSYINELNFEVYLCYMAIQQDVDSVINKLGLLERKYFALGRKEQESFFYKIRETYNNNKHKIDTNNYDSKNFSERASLTIFLNRTCFNGLYRVNSKGYFNVPFGRYNKPTICDSANLRAVSQLLQEAVITNNDFAIIKKYIKPNSLVYFDPPYRPLNKTSNFTSYAANVFNDSEQVRLAQFVKDLSQHKKVKIMLSNSDPKNVNPEDDFFDDLYKHEGFTIKRLNAKRMINCNAFKRGNISEILILNY